MADKGVGSVSYAVIDAFTDKPFGGNPAAVCMLEPSTDKDTQWMQNVAAEFNLSQTAFLTRRSSTQPNANSAEFDLRWFTPLAEVDLCGHATLASAHFLFTSGFINCNSLHFHTRSGILTAVKIEGFNEEEQHFGKWTERFAIELNLPQVSAFDCDSLDISFLLNTLKGFAVQNVKKTSKDDLIIELASGEQVESLQPQFDEIQKYRGRGVIVTALAPKQSGFDFYSRFFCPKLGVDEDPVCGSAHCALAPYWAKKLGKSELIAYQASKRGGKLVLKLVKDEKRVLLQGEAVKVMSGILAA